MNEKTKERKFKRRIYFNKMKLGKLMLREMRIPLVSFMLLVIGFTMGMLGAVANFIVISENQGRMPVWSQHLSYDGDTHFIIINAPDVNYLYLADIFPIGDYMCSLGDILIIFSVFLIILSLIFMPYNDTIRLIVYFKQKRKNGKHN